jgi:hypothetical protein
VGGQSRKTTDQVVGQTVSKMGLTLKNRSSGLLDSIICLFGHNVLRHANDEWASKKNGRAKVGQRFFDTE